MRSAWLLMFYAAIAAIDSPAATLTTLHAFSCAAEGIPYGALAIGETPGGNPVLYGVTSRGGPAADGTVYMLTPSGAGAWTETTLHTFSGVDGIDPAAGLLLGPGEILYGTTRNGGGDKGRGTVFSVSPPTSPGGAWTEQVLHRFTGPPDGALPESMLAIGSDTDGRMALYGTTTYGGATNSGTVFSLSPPMSPGGPWKETVLYSFIKSDHQGYMPYSGVVIGSNVPSGLPVLYGVTGWGGGGAGAVGSVYALVLPANASDAWTYAVLYRFSPISGGYSPGPLTLSSGPGGQPVIYGTTAISAPTGSGTVYSLTASRGVPWIESQLFEFLNSARTEGADPEGGVAIGSGGILFGTASQGGPTGNGTVFSLSPPTSTDGPWSETMLYAFTGGDDGSFPTAPVSIGRGGTLYSTTSYAGGASNCGTVFSLKP